MTRSCRRFRRPSRTLGGQHRQFYLTAVLLPSGAIGVAHTAAENRVVFSSQHPSRTTTFFDFFFLSCCPDAALEASNLRGVLSGVCPFLRLQAQENLTCFRSFTARQSGSRHGLPLRCSFFVKLVISRRPMYPLNQLVVSPLTAPTTPDRLDVCFNSLSCVTLLRRSWAQSRSLQALRGRRRVCS